MAQISDDAFAFDGELLTISDAMRMIRALPPVEGVENIALWAADRRVLADDVFAARDLPPFDNSAVDGYAVRFSEVLEARVLPVAGRAAAGARPIVLTPRTTCRIFTGAALPEGADTVFMQEDVRFDAEARVVFPSGLRRGDNTRSRGEDTANGARALPRGRRLRPQDLALVAALGLRELPVRRAIRVVLFSTGDELVEPGGATGRAQLYDSNRVMLAALLTRAGAHVTDLGILPDRAAAVEAALAAAAPDHDLILTSGGVSVGEEDHVRAAVEAIGTLVFWRLAIKPGRPVAMGTIAGVPFVGLPGNPVAAFVTFARIVRPLLAALSGETYEPQAVPIRAGFDYRKKAGRREYVRARLVMSETGGIVAHKHPVDGAGVLTSLTDTDGLVELVETVTSVKPGDEVGFIPYDLLT